MLEPGQQIVATYPYTDEEGNLIYEVVRIEPGSNGRKKDFKQRRVLPDGTTAWGLTKETRRVLYGLPELLGADEVALCCGEKDCATAASLGFVSTTNSGGEGVKWIDEEGNRPEWVEALRGKSIIFFPDNDQAGRSHADNIIDALEGVAKRLSIVWVTKGKDLTEFFEQGGTNEELNRLIQVAKLPENAPVKRVRRLIQKKGDPIARESEKLVLGAVMAGLVPFSEIELLAPKDFGVPSHRVIFSALQELESKTGAVDVKSVIQHLGDRELLDQADGVGYLADISDDLPAVFNIDSHVEQIQKKAHSRKLLGDLMDSAESLVVGADHDVVRAHIVESVEKSAVYSSKDSPTSSVLEIIGTFETFFGKRKRGIMCEPIDSVMESCFGLQEGQLVVIGGRPSSGKSSLATLIAAYSARAGFETDILSFEISKQECLLKMICMAAKVPFLDVYAGRIDDTQRARLTSVANAFTKMPLRIDDGPGWNLLKIRNHLKKRKASGNPVRLLLIDYLQLMGSGRQDGRRDLELGQITRGLKLMSKEFGCTIILLSQLNRDMDKNNRKPQLSDLRDSGSIEADADMVWFTWQDLQNDTLEEIERNASILVAKQRNGPVGEFQVRFAKPFAFFYDPRIKAIDYAKLGYGHLISA